MKKLSVFLIILVFFSCKSVQDVYDFESAHINGVVYSWGNNGCANAEISITLNDDPAGKSFVVSSDIYGKFTIPDLKKGTHYITVKKDGYETNSFVLVFLNRTQSIYVYLISGKDLLASLEEQTKKKNFNTASEIGERLLKLEPENPRGLFLTAGAYMKLGEFEKSLKLIETLEKLQPDSVWPRILAADIYELHLNDYDKALAELNKIHVDKQDSDIKKRMQRIESMTGGDN